MTLDFARVGEQIRAMEAHLVDSTPQRMERQRQARELFRRLAPNWEGLAAQARKNPVSAAAPLEPLTTIHPRPCTPANYEVLASDGSTIEPDRHGVAMYAMINLGRIRIRYGEQPAASLETRASLIFHPDDLYTTQAGKPVLLQGRLLDARRTMAEMETLAELAKDGPQDGTVQVALADGLLTIWRQDWAAADADEVTEKFRDALESIADRRLPLAAYVSNPHSHLVVDLLREAALCGKASGQCALACGQDGCSLLGLVDVQLYEFLKPGDRSATFEVVGRDADRYGVRNRSHFCYVHTGREVARLEIPAWVAQDPEALDLIHAVVCDQSDRGLGYPVALARAHEQAVITAGDRRAVQQLVVAALSAVGLRTGFSEKQTSKNLRAV